MEILGHNIHQDIRTEVSKSTLSDVLVCGAWEQGLFPVLILRVEQVLEAEGYVAGILL
jgi:hypothetical protein